MAIIQRLAIGPVTEAVVQHRHRPSRHRTRQVNRKSRLAHATVCVDDNRTLCGEQRRQDVCLLHSWKHLLRFRDQRGRRQEIDFGHSHCAEYVVEPNGAVLRALIGCPAGDQFLQLERSLGVRFG
ncbi:hypothetical protein D3C84_948970 [compost metagenome]